MEAAKLELLKKTILGEIRRDTNGAIVDVMSKLNDGEPFISYGVTLPKIKEVAKQYYPNHELAISLFASNIRELKLTAIYIDNPQELTCEQMELWQKSFISLEIAEHCASMLFSKSSLSLKMALRWLDSENSFTVKAAYLIGTRRAKFHYDEREANYYQQLFDAAIKYLSSSNKNPALEAAENFLAAIANKQDTLKKELLNMFEQGQLSSNIDNIKWQLL